MCELFPTLLNSKALATPNVCVSVSLIIDDRSMHGMGMTLIISVWLYRYKSMGAITCVNADAEADAWCT